ncbi:thymidine phosphorylase [Roseitalea porphyridii]|uniref:Thymidine phosphorylase n=1 Tax=Roseitalea porphyridii TaxID=1852022 RepID=A0A4P6UY55_9HYPH|nr:thymidine phosphorylase [Roseitalea porphyridii]QBK29413.1 thymidine phosphorylase [Roseitalea porphyridii]
MLIQEIIRAKRDGRALTPEQVTEFIAGVTDGSVTDAQIAGLAMAIFFNGMDRDETVALTLAMRDSGDVLDWSDIDRPVADKHSTGGVGDNVSLMLAPMAAACGLAVPMISGRGLGHTGGTLDKMESIPGYDVAPDNATFHKVTREVGCAIIGQTGDLAPADKRIYGVRDVTATVENLSLITASILSKKLAAGLSSLVLDVKFGNGAFIDDMDDTRALAKSLVEVANGAGTKTAAILTDMNEPLASAAGNAVEVANAVRFLTGEHRDPRLQEVVLALVVEMIVLSGHETDLARAGERALQALDDGTAAQCFSQMVAGLGGPADFVERYEDHLPVAPLIEDVTAPEPGFLAGWDTRALGVAVVEMGGGRRRREDDVDHAVGLDRIAGTGTKLDRGDPVARLHARDEASMARAREAVLAALTIGDETPAERPVIAETITG